MSVPKYRLDAIETIGRKILQEYDPALLDGPPQAVPIETIIETKFDLTLEYHCLRKNGIILGETIFDEGAAILYDQDEKRYRLIVVKAGTILVEERLCVDRLLGRLRFTCAHELGHCGSCTRSCTPAQAMWLPMKEKHLWMKATAWSNGRRMLWLLLSSCPCRKSKEVFTVCVQAGAMSSWLRKWLRSSKSPSRPCVFGWKHAISYKFGTASPPPKRGVQPHQCSQTLLYAFCSQFSEHGRRRMA